MLLEIQGRPFEQLVVFLKRAQASIASVTQQAPHVASLSVMIHLSRRLLFANRTQTTLLLDQFLDFGRADSISLPKVGMATVSI